MELFRIKAREGAVERNQGRAGIGTRGYNQKASYIELERFQGVENA